MLHLHTVLYYPILSRHANKDPLAAETFSFIWSYMDLCVAVANAFLPDILQMYIATFNIPPTYYITS